MTQVRKVLEAAIRAPSGENAQPWRFVVREQGEGATIDVYLHEASDTSLYNWGHRASYLALGACVENMRTAAAAYGYTPDITPFPEKSDMRHVARVRLVQDASPQQNSSADAVSARITNRKPFNKDAISEEILSALRKAAAFDTVSIDFVSDEEDKKRLANVGAANEAIMLGNESMHQFFFSHVNWTKEEDEAKRTGFFVRSLELPPPARMGFAVARSWRRCRALNRMVHFNEVVAAQNAVVYAQAPVFGIITAVSESPESAFAAGRAFESCWLEATRRGLSLQPLMGTLFLSLAIRAKEHAGLTQDECQRVEKALQDVQRIFALKDRIPYALFRVGFAAAPSAQTRRHPVDEVTEWTV